MIKVHVLMHGKTLCGFGHGTLPGKWPKGHKWVAPGTRVIAPGIAAEFCDECSEQAQKIADTAMRT